MRDFLSDHRLAAHVFFYLKVVAWCGSMVTVWLLFISRLVKAKRTTTCISEMLQANEIVLIRRSTTLLFSLRGLCLNPPRGPSFMMRHNTETIRVTLR